MIPVPAWYCYALHFFAGAGVFSLIIDPLLKYLIRKWH